MNSRGAQFRHELAAPVDSFAFNAYATASGMNIASNGRSLDAQLGCGSVHDRTISWAQSIKCNQLALMCYECECISLGSNSTSHTIRSISHAHVFNEHHAQCDEHMTVFVCACGAHSYWTACP
jgi:hypothetical protein